MSTFSQVVEATLTSVKAQVARCDAEGRAGIFRGHVSQNLIVRHAMKHAESAEPGILGPVCEAVRDRLYHDALEARALAALVR